MIKIEHVITATPEQMEFIIEGMKNPLNSWRKSDSYPGYNCTLCGKIERDGICSADDPERAHCSDYYGFELGDADNTLMQNLAQAGTDHRKFMRMMPVYARITAPLYWWKEFETHKVGTVSNSCSTMHKIQEKELDRGDFSHEHIPKGSDAYSDTWDIRTSNMFFPVNIKDGVYFSSEDILDFTIQALNHYREKYLKTKYEEYWWQMIQLLPSSYNQTRNVMMNYEVLANIYKSRRNHKLDEWRTFCDWIVDCLPYSEIILASLGKRDQKVMAEHNFGPAEWLKEQNKKEE